MEILNRILSQLEAVRLPLYAVTLTTIPRIDTPVLLMLHWHGFHPSPGQDGQTGDLRRLPAPTTALQINDRWNAWENVERSLLDAAWQLGAWDVQREELRACSYPGASAKEALACRQAFGEFSGKESSHHLIAEAPDREALLTVAATKGYLRWQFRPVQGGLWEASRDDATLDEGGRRTPPCPVTTLSPLHGGRLSRTVYRLGRNDHIWLP